MRLVSWFLAIAITAHAEDWPTFGHDNRRSHVTKESLKLPLSQSWVYESPALPQTAWTGPAKWDAYASNEGLQSMRNFDPAFFVTSVGDSVYFGSSADHGVHCMDVTTGKERWVSFADGAVRLPPTWADGKLYFGSDDGFARCLDAKTGREIWKFRPVEAVKMIPSNGKLMSPFPIRTGVLVDEGIAFFGASLFPWEKSYLCAVDVADGQKHFVNEISSVTLQGILLASSERLYAPQGRSVPLIFAKSSGSRLGDVAGTGGVYCILTPEEQFIGMPQNQKSAENVVKLSDPKSKEAILNIPGASQMLVSGKFAYFHQRTQLRAIDRFQKEADKQKVWATPQTIPSTMILAGNSLFLGQDGKVSAIDSATGKSMWSAEVAGRVYGLAAANGRLFVSTDRGHIYCFNDSTVSSR